MVVTFADLLTPGGIVVAAGFVTTLVGLVKSAFPPIDSRISGATLAFVLSAILYVLAAVAIAPANLDGYLPIAFGWVGTAAAAIGIKSGLVHVAAVRGGYAGLETPVVRDHSDEDDSALIPMEEPEPAP